MNPNRPRPALREPMLWLVMAIPLATIVGGLTTLWLAETGDSTDVVSDPVRRTGQVQDADLGPDLEAARRGLSARVRIDTRAGRVEAEIAPTPDPDQVLVLRFVHGLRAEADLALPLAAQAGRWQARLPPLPATDWRLVLSDRDGHWRLVGRLPAGADGAQLLPAVSPP